MRLLVDKFLTFPRESILKSEKKQEEEEENHTIDTSLSTHISIL